jgi:hypothetical protein
MSFSSITITRGFSNIAYLFLAGSSIRSSVQLSSIAPAAQSQSNSSSTWFNFADSPGEREETSLGLHLLPARSDAWAFSTVSSVFDALIGMSPRKRPACFPRHRLDRCSKVLSSTGSATATDAKFPFFQTLRRREIYWRR